MHHFWPLLSFGKGTWTSWTQPGILCNAWSLIQNTQKIELKICFLKRLAYISSKTTAQNQMQSPKTPKTHQQITGQLSTTPFAEKNDLKSTEIFLPWPSAAKRSLHLQSRQLGWSDSTSRSKWNVLTRIWSNHATSVNLAKTTCLHLSTKKNRQTG